MKHYYALEQINGKILFWSKYVKPILHVFNSKKERDNFVKEYAPININNSIDVTTSDIARTVYTRVNDGIRIFTDDVIMH